jgi:hypothetical protein
MIPAPNPQSRTRGFIDQGARYGFVPVRWNTPNSASALVPSTQGYLR